MRGAVIPLNQTLYIESDSTLGEYRPAADMFSIDSVSDIQIALSSVSAEEEDGMEGHTEGERRESSRRESSCSAAQDTFRNDNILLLIPSLNGSIDWIEQSLHRGF